MKAWDVFLGKRHLDTVFYDDDCEPWYVLRGLIEHDGYPSEIRVSCEASGESAE